MIIPVVQFPTTTFVIIWSSRPVVHRRHPRAPVVVQTGLNSVRLVVQVPWQFQLSINQWLIPISRLSLRNHQTWFVSIDRWTNKDQTLEFFSSTRHRILMHRLICIQIRWIQRRQLNRRMIILSPIFKVHAVIVCFNHWIMTTLNLIEQRSLESMMNN